MKNIIFLDIDGVLNCELHYHSKQFTDYINNGDKENELEYYAHQICRDRIKMLNKLCEETESGIVISSTWRTGKTIKQLKEIFNYCGATFDIICKTGHCDCRVRGVEIQQWLYDNAEKHFGIKYFDFYRYAIIDDDSDMLLNQQNHFFQTDTYSGLTPSTCYKIKRFFTHKTF